jgi:hypothetical protein
MTTTPTTAPREVLERASQIFGTDKGMHWDTAMLRASEQIEAEHAARAERQAKQAAVAEEHRRAVACRSCDAPGQLTYIGASERERLQGSMHGFVDCLCSACRHVVLSEWTRRQGAELVDGKTRSALANEYLDRREGV